MAKVDLPEFQIVCKMGDTIFRVTEFYLHPEVGVGWRVIQSIF